MLPSVRDHGLVEPKVLNPSDELCTPTQSSKLALRIDVGIDRAPVEYVAMVNRHDNEVSRSDMFSKYPRASSSSIRFSSCMCHQLVSSHGPDGSRTRVLAPDLTHPRSTAVSCRRSAKVVSSDPLFSGPRPPSFGPARAHSVRAR